MYDKAETREERSTKFDEMLAQMTPEQQAFVKRNLNRQKIPELLYYQLPRGITKNMDDSIEARKKHLTEIGRADLIGTMVSAYRREEDPEEAGGVSREVLNDLQKIRLSGYEDLMTNKAIAAYMKRRMDPSFSPYIDTYIEADRGKRGNMITRSDEGVMYKQIEAMRADAEKNLDRRQLEYIEEKRNDPTYGDLEFLLWHYDRHPREGLRKNDATFQREYKEWRGNRSPYGVG
jgi:hypothetical protein